MDLTVTCLILLRKTPKLARVINSCYNSGTVNKTEKMMEKVLYTSLIFERSFLVPVDALPTYKKRDAALLALKDLGGIHAPHTKEVTKLRQTMLNAKRKIEREGWFCVPV